MKTSAFQPAGPPPWAGSPGRRLGSLRILGVQLRAKLRNPAWLVLAAVAVLWWCGPSPRASTAGALPVSDGWSALSSVLRILGALGFVFAAFFSGLWVWKNWQTLVTRRGPASNLAILETRSLGQRHTLYVVGYAQQRMLVAASPAGVTLLTALPTEDDSGRAELQAQPVPSSGFGTMLLQKLGSQS